MFIPHRRIAVFLMTWLTMIAFTATLYMFDPLQANPPVMAQYDSSGTLTNPISEVFTFSHTLELGSSVERIALSEHPQENRVTPRQLAHKAHQLAPIKPIERTTKRPRLERLSNSTYTTTQTNQSAALRPAMTCTVTTTTDNGAGSLRQCLLDAVVSDSINFDPQLFPPTTPATITLSTPLPWITTDGLTIDGSEAGVVLNGSELSEGHGLVFTGTNGITVQGLQILNFPRHGIALTGGTSHSIIGGKTPSGSNLLSGNGWSDGNGVAIFIVDPGTTDNAVLGNYIGTNATGTAPMGNKWGVVIGFGAQNNIIGGETEEARNLISGNSRVGIQIQNEGTSGNQVLGNYIGTDKSGTVALGNTDGIQIGFGAQNNLIGGETEGARNLISGNMGVGVWIQNPGTNDNRIQGNYIGTNASGTAPLGNTSGVLIKFGAQGNLVGGETEGARNLISGNAESGIWIQNEGTNGNQVRGNYIGTDESGTVALANTLGILIGFGAQNNVIGGETEGARNLISGNIEAGVQIQNEETSSNQVLGNYIGTDESGTVALANTNGILIGDGAQDNLIGGETEAARNLISGNIEVGVLIQNEGTSGNQVQGNHIGTDASGTVALGNYYGIIIGFGAQNNLIGGESEQVRNLISGNIEKGIQIQDEGTSGNQVLGNYIGTNATGTVSLGNLDGVSILNGAQSNIIGGNTEEARNIISGNIDTGITIQNEGTINNVIKGNYIGTNITGTASLGNADGVVVGFGAQNNLVGGQTKAERNIISGNIGAGMLIQNEKTSQNVIEGNYIGTDVTGTASLGNSDGINIGFGAQNNLVGGQTEGARNLISGHTGAGIQIQDEGTSNNLIQGNYIGTDVFGTASLSNTWGVSIGSGAQNNFVGGQTEGARNLISGNTYGIWFQSKKTSHNVIEGNYIGTGPEGTVPLGNDIGIFVGSGSQQNIIGGQTEGARNLISGNMTGIFMQNEQTNSNQVQGNYIGTDHSGMAQLGNGKGVVIGHGAQNNLIGGESEGAGNLISGNGPAIWLQNEGTTGNLIKGNYIGTDKNGSAPLSNLYGVFIDSGAQNNVIGGQTEGARNLISGNRWAGIQIEMEETSSNIIQGNYIGTNASGTMALGNPAGIAILGGVQNLVGGLTEGAGNLISGNTRVGIQLQSEETSGNIIQGNYIGTNASGTMALGNANGLVIGFGAQNNVIGDPVHGNLISGNTEAGIQIQNEKTSGNQVLGNYIGSDAVGSNPLSNGWAGISLLDGAASNTIGISNTIAYNGEAGVIISGTTTLGNTITRNIIKDNDGPPIKFINVPEPILPSPPLFISHLENVLKGTACENCRIEIFANPDPQPAATMFLDEVIADMEGTFTITLDNVPTTLPYLSATVTDEDGTTSAVYPATLTYKLHLPVVLR